MTETSSRAARLRRADVWVGDVRVGTVGAVLADSSLDRVVGLEVTNAEGRRWFLPWVACTMDDGIVRSWSSLVFLPEAELDFYVRNGVRVTADELERAEIAASGHLSFPGGPARTGVSGARVAGITSA